ncbi:hypothetical protein PHLGIDRAFT_22921 [Phlebiopsis gigantea 11061_1 CR5-6]|uniref:AAA+ ATPase domain-containing protein n=1 Tax=Phlebiopsis gigantea (strain 11061_1 CR5-6) TaxID=745531 RepID=A0A0C3SAP9_PHLG1|nr:hypothetical protein PHLGIDRAFT_22921 [Phlebiopsis gigantea 11061_1 CR5-6]
MSLPLLEFEQQSAEAVVRERLSSWSLERLQEEGYCLMNMDAYWLDGGSSHFGVGRFVANFMLGPGVLLPAEHQFESGTQVLVTHLDPLREDPRRGCIVSATDSQLRVAFNERFNLDEGQPWRLDMSCSAIAYERMKAAVQSLHANPAQQLRGPPPKYHRPHGEPLDAEAILQGTYLRDVLLRGFREGDATSVPPQDNFFAPNAHLVSWARRYARPNPVVVPGDPDLHSKGLNETQVRAVAVMLGGMSGPDPSSSSGALADDALALSSARAPPRRSGGSRAALIHGPPGTGKTKTIIETVRLLKEHFRVPQPVLLCTYTNAAVDNLVEGFVAPDLAAPASSGRPRSAPQPLRPLRVGSPGRVRATLGPYTLEAQMAAHPRAKDLEGVEQRITEVIKRRKELYKRIEETRPKVAASLREHGHGHAGTKTGIAARLDAMEMDLLVHGKKEAALKKKQFAIRNEIMGDVVRSADVVCTTCITSASLPLKSVDFPIVFIDEASMSTEPASLIPLMKGSQHVALIGDHKQLPPVITSLEAQDQGLGYRMHPAISRFPAAEFYGTALRDGTVDAAGNVAAALSPPHSMVFPELARMGAGGPEGAERRPSVVFLDHLGSESVKDRSRVNWAEARIVCSLVEDLLLRNPTLTGSDIGIIAPYAAQITLLTRLLTADAGQAARFEAVLGPARAAETHEVEVKTVDGFEGREKDVVVFSTVRNNAAGAIGFLADRRRLNVGLTRAKRGLFVVGSLRTLRIGKTQGHGPGADVLEAVEDLRVGGEEATGVPAQKKRKGKKAQGAEAWRRYASFVTEQHLVLHLEGERLRRVLDGNRRGTLVVVAQQANRTA